MLTLNANHTLIVAIHLQETHLDQILLNGNNIAVLVPGGKPDDN